MNNEFHHVLYTDENNEIIGLDEVQLLDPIPKDRIPALMALLDHDDIYLSYQSALILAAWNVQPGINALKQFIQQRPDKNHIFEPHRLHGEDNVYDVIADALGIALLSGAVLNDIIPLLREILSIYDAVYCESRLKSVLLEYDFHKLLPEIVEAIDKTIECGRLYQASQLLPVLAQYAPQEAQERLTPLEALIDQDKRIAPNILETKEILGVNYS